MYYLYRLHRLTRRLCLMLNYTVSISLIIFYSLPSIGGRVMRKCEQGKARRVFSFLCSLATSRPSTKFNRVLCYQNTGSLWRIWTAIVMLYTSFSTKITAGGSAKVIVFEITQSNQEFPNYPKGDTVILQC